MKGENRLEDEDIGFGGSGALLSVSCCWRLDIDACIERICASCVAISVAMMSASADWTAGTGGGLEAAAAGWGVVALRRMARVGPMLGEFH